MWTHRIILEANQYEENTFATLTYSDDNLPAGHSLAPDDLQNFLKRLRKKISPSKIRYYAVGEYGDTTERPHYHLCLFGFPTCQRDLNSRYMCTDKVRCCPPCNTIADTWGLGGIFLGNLETKSAQYVCGYVTKKMTRYDDPRLKNRHPEFCRMSLRPGIGATAMHDVASTLLQFNLDTSQADVPSALRHGTRSLPLGRYLRKKLRTLIGHDEKTPQSEITKLSEEMRPLLLASQTDPENLTLKSQIIKEGAQSARNQEARSKIFKQRKSL